MCLYPFACKWRAGRTQAYLLLEVTRQLSIRGFAVMGLLIPKVVYVKRYRSHRNSCKL